MIIGQQMQPASLVQTESVIPSVLYCIGGITLSEVNLLFATREFGDPDIAEE